MGFARANPASVKKSYPLQDIDKEISTPWQYWVRSQEVLIPYTGHPGNFQEISYARLLCEDDALVSLRNKTVIVGMTAAGMGTRFATPVSPLNRQPMTGVEWHANVFSMLTNNRVIYPIPTAMTAILSAVWVAGILAMIVLMKSNLTIPMLLGVLTLTLLLAGLILE